MLVVGLTGGIASGKSLVAEQFAKLGIDIIDADLISRKLVAKGERTLNQIVEYFGEAILKEDGSLNRRSLREIIFADNTKRLWLENLLHPLIRNEISAQLLEVKSPYGLVVIPLLSDRRVYPMIKRVLLVDAPEHLQLARVQERDQINLLQAKAILMAQSSRVERVVLADDIIINDGEVKDLDKQVLALHQNYLQYAKN